MEYIYIPKEKGSTTYLTHNFHSYPAKFVPQIPNYFIKKLTNEYDVVLDPFVGCGTTMVECKLLNRIGIGIDLNPIATLISESKTTNLNISEINEVVNSVGQIKKIIYNFYEKGIFNYQVPHFHNRDHWFQKNVQKELTIIIGYINKLQNRKISNLLKTAISAIIVSVSNQESDTRYAAKNKNIVDFQTFQVFEKKIENMIVRIKDFSSISNGINIDIFNDDSTKIDFLEDNSVDLVITSPPYANTYDYYLYHKLRMYWLGYDVNIVKDKEIGSRNKHSSQKRDINEFNDNLKLCFKETVRVLKPNKYAVIVIGDSIIRKKFYDAKKMMITLGSKIGLEFVDSKSEKLHKTTRMFNPKFTNTQKSEHIMLFKNTKNEI